MINYSDLLLIESEKMGLIASIFSFNCTFIDFQRVKPIDSLPYFKMSSVNIWIHLRYARYAVNGGTLDKSQRVTKSMRFILWGQWAQHLMLIWSAVAKISVWTVKAGRCENSLKVKHLGHLLVAGSQVLNGKSSKYNSNHLTYVSFQTL